MLLITLMANEERPKRRRWWIGLLLGALVLFAAMSGASKLNTHEFSFLNRYHPRIEPPHGATAFLNTPYGKALIYTFSKDNAPQVLPALRRELSTAKGYHCNTLGDSTAFVRSVSGQDFGALHIPSDSETMRILLRGQVKLPKGSCMVMVVRERTWLERQVDAVKKFLHWD